jgi:hypothetical protein
VQTFNQLYGRSPNSGDRVRIRELTSRGGLSDPNARRQKARRANVSGVVVRQIPGYGGDVFEVNIGGKVAAYEKDELYPG